VFGGEKRRKFVAEREGGIRGMVLQTTSNEVYLREDISCGFPGCVSCDERQNGAPPALNERMRFFSRAVVGERHRSVGSAVLGRLAQRLYLV
jgi:hypothetical protein